MNVQMEMWRENKPKQLHLVKVQGDIIPQPTRILEITHLFVLSSVKEDQDLSR